jgi:hypothetical protein
MWAKYLLAVALSLSAGVALAQKDPGPGDFQEIEVPPPPVYHKDGLITLDMSASSSLTYGLDPDTLSIGSDGVMRYVMVAYSPSGSINALYEGLRCETSEVKTYARSSELGRWTAVQEAKWRRLENTAASRHALALAKRGVCDTTRLATRNATEMIKLLRTPTTSQVPY